MRLTTVFVGVAAAASAVLWLDRATRKTTSRRPQTARTQPVEIHEWEGEGGALRVSGAHFSPPVEPAIRSELADAPPPSDPTMK
jgi:hypothetical protein